uniref:Phosphatidylinositol glycan anchor biosynthesis, class X n=1 Tax=Mus musculus TaxID=10090 RepID=F6WL03_MOUSE
MAAGAVAWLLLWAAWLVGRLAADFSDAPFSAVCPQQLLTRFYIVGPSSVSQLLILLASCC